MVRLVIISKSERISNMDYQVGPKKRQVPNAELIWWEKEKPTHRHREITPGHIWGGGVDIGNRSV